MKINCIVFCLLIWPSSASFFDQFQSVFQPVQQSFGKLVSNVVTDMRDTIDCTVLAVEHVFSFGGMFGGPSEYDKKCGNQQKKSQDESYTTPPQPPRDIHTAPPERFRSSGIKLQLSQHIDNSISTTNLEIDKIMKEKRVHHTIENVEGVLKSETDRLAEIGILLRKELDNISQSVKNKIHGIKFDPKEPTIEDVLEEVQILYEVEQDHENSSVTNEIRQVFDNVLNVLEVNNTNSLSSDDDAIKEIMKALETNSADTVVNIDSEFERWKTNIKQSHEKAETVEVKNETVNFPKSFKEVARKIVDRMDASTEQSRSLVDDMNHELVQYPILNSEDELDTASSSQINHIIILPFKEIIVQSKSKEIKETASSNKFNDQWKPTSANKSRNERGDKLSSIIYDPIDQLSKIPQINKDDQQSSKLSSPWVVSDGTTLIINDRSPRILTSSSKIPSNEDSNSDFVIRDDKEITLSTRSSSSDIPYAKGDCDQSSSSIPKTASDGTCCNDQDDILRPTKSSIENTSTKIYDDHSLTSILKTGNDDTNRNGDKLTTTTTSRSEMLRTKKVIDQPLLYSSNVINDVSDFNDRHERNIHNTTFIENTITKEHQLEKKVMDDTGKNNKSRSTTNARNEIVSTKKDIDQLLSSTPKTLSDVKSRKEQHDRSESTTSTIKHKSTVENYNQLVSSTPKTINDDTNHSDKDNKSTSRSTIISTKKYIDQPLSSNSKAVSVTNYNEQDGISVSTTSTIENEGPVNNYNQLLSSTLNTVKNDASRNDSNNKSISTSTYFGSEILNTQNDIDQPLSTTPMTLSQNDRSISTSSTVKNTSAEEHDNPLLSSIPKTINAKQGDKNNKTASLTTPGHFTNEKDTDQPLSSTPTPKSVNDVTSHNNQDDRSVLNTSLIESTSNEEHDNLLLSSTPKLTKDDTSRSDKDNASTSTSTSTTEILSTEEDIEQPLSTTPKTVNDVTSHNNQDDISVPNTSLIENISNEEHDNQVLSSTPKTVKDNMSRSDKNNTSLTPPTTISSNEILSIKYYNDQSLSSILNGNKVEQTSGNSRDTDGHNFSSGLTTTPPKEPFALSDQNNQTLTTTTPVDATEQQSQIFTTPIPYRYNKQSSSLPPYDPSSQPFIPDAYNDQSLSSASSYQIIQQPIPKAYYDQSLSPTPNDQVIQSPVPNAYSDQSLLSASNILGPNDQLNQTTASNAYNDQSLPIAQNDQLSQTIVPGALNDQSLTPTPNVSLVQTPAQLLSSASNVELSHTIYTTPSSTDYQYDEEAVAENLKEIEEILNQPPGPYDYDSRDYDNTKLADNEETPLGNMELLNEYFGPIDPDSDLHKQAVNEAKQLIKQSTYTDKVMNDFLNNIDPATTTDVFSNPELLNFQ